MRTWPSPADRVQFRRAAAPRVPVPRRVRQARAADERSARVRDCLDAGVDPWRRTVSRTPGACPARVGTIEDAVLLGCTLAMILAVCAAAAGADGQRAMNDKPDHSTVPPDTVRRIRGIFANVRRCRPIPIFAAQTGSVGSHGPKRSAAGSVLRQRPGLERYPGSPGASSRGALTGLRPVRPGLLAVSRHTRTLTPECLVTTLSQWFARNIDNSRFMFARSRFDTSIPRYSNASSGRVSRTDLQTS